MKTRVNSIVKKTYMISVFFVFLVNLNSCFLSEMF